MRLQLQLGGLAGLQLLGLFLFQLLVLHVFGVGSQSDAFIAAQGVPSVLFAVLMVSMQSVWQPRLAVATGREAWLAEQRVAQGQGVILFWIPVAALIATAFVWIQVLFPGFRAEQQHLTLSMTPALLAAAALNGHSQIYTIALRAQGSFVFPEAASLGATILALCVGALVLRGGRIELAAWIMMARSAMVCTVLHLRAGRPRPDLKGGWRARDAWQKMRPLMTGSALYKTNPLVDRYWSSMAGGGGMTALNLAQTGVGAVATVLERAICMPVGPRLARLAGGGDYASFRRAYLRCVWQAGLATAAVAVVLLVPHALWVAALKELLHLEPAQAELIWLLCTLLIGYLFIAVAGTIVAAAFYALGDVRTPVTVGVLGFVVGVGLKSVAFLAFGLKGLVAATSAYYLLNAGVMVFLLERLVRRKARDGHMTAALEVDRS